MKINTDKTQFLSKRIFKAKKMTKECFKDNLYKKYKLLYDLYGDSEEELSKNNNCKNLILRIAEFLEMNSYDHFEKLEEDLNIAGMGFDIMNWEDISGQLTLTTLDNGFTYLSIYSSVGDDAIAPIYSILYFDENIELRAYCPYCGNLVFVGANTQMCTYGGYGDEDEATERLFEEYNEIEPEDDDDEFSEVFLRLYGKKYGCLDSSNCNSLEDLEFDTDLMKEDIKSNVNLC